MIYAVEAIGLRLVKLGRSKDEHTFVWRFDAIRTHCPVDVQILGVWTGAGSSEERRLHKQWSANHVKGEWFRLDEALEEFIGSMFKPFNVTENARELARLLRTNGEIPLLVDDRRFAPLRDNVAQYEPGQEVWVGAREEHRTTSRRLIKKSHRPHEVVEILRLRAEGRTFKEIGEAVGKSTDASRRAWDRAQGGEA